MEETQIPKSCRTENIERKEKKILPWMNSNSEVWWTSLNEYPKKRLVHEERDNNQSWSYLK